MFARGEIETLQRRKQELLVRGEVNRRLLAVESQRLRSALAWADVGIGVARQLKPAWIIAAPLLGFWVARNAAAGSRLWGKLAFAWQLFQSASAIVRQFRTAAATDESRPS